MIKWFAALAALSLTAAPAAAQAGRTAAPVGDAESLTGGVWVAWVLAALVAIAAVLIITDDNESDLPTSP